VALCWDDLQGEASRADLFYRLIQSYQVENNLPVSTQKQAGSSFALRKAFVFPDDADFDTDGTPRKDSFFLIDISHYTDDNIPLDRLRAQRVIGVYVKATQSTNYRDAKFTRFWGELGKLEGSLKVYRGAYHFLSSSAPGAEQAAAFLRLMNETGGARDDDLPPVVDLEWDVRRAGGTDGWAKKSPDSIVAELKSFLEYIEKHGEGFKKPMVYTAKSWWTERIKSEARFAELSKYQIWIADYSKSSHAVEIPRVPNKSAYHLWQFTDNARLGLGYDKPLDANIFKGTEDEFVEQFVQSGKP
jgi:lysozyme